MALGGDLSGFTIIKGKVVISTIGYDPGPTDYIGTIGTILSANISVSVPPITAIATIGTLQTGNVTSSISGGQLDYIATIGTVVFGGGGSSAYLGTLAYLGTVGTLESQANVAVASAIGTIQSPVLIAYNQATVTGTAGASQMMTVSGTIKGTGGALYGAVITARTAGTLTLLHSLNATTPGVTATLFQFPMAANGMTSFFYPPGITFFGSLIASIQGGAACAVMIA